MRNSCVAFSMSVLLLSTAACRRDMQDQPKYKPLAASNFFADGRSARPIPTGTVARDEINDTDPFHTGQVDGAFLDTIPLPITLDVLQRGRDRYNIFCTPCHGMLGYGDGMVSRRGVYGPANFHTDRLRHVPPGYIYRVITNGYGAMGEYASQTSVRDRWTIVAYVRALQLSRHANIGDLPAMDRAKLQSAENRKVSP